MPTWADFLVGLIPFTLVALLLWIRLRAAGVSDKVAVKFVVRVFALVAIAIAGFGSAAKGWRVGSFWLLALGGIAVTVSVLALRMSLHWMWGNFPLPSDGNEENRGESGG